MSQTIPARLHTYPVRIWKDNPRVESLRKDNPRVESLRKDNPRVESPRKDNPRRKILRKENLRRVLQPVATGMAQTKADRRKRFRPSPTSNTAL